MPHPSLLAWPLLLLLAACAGGAQTASSGGADAVPPAPAAPPVWPAAAEEPPNPLARLLPTLVADGRAMELLAVNLRPQERMIAARLVAPDGRELVAAADRIRHGQRLAGGDYGPRVGLFGGSNSGVGVTLSLDVFGRRASVPEGPADSTRAWTRIPLPAGADPAAWRAEALIEDSFGARYLLPAD